LLGTLKHIRVKYWNEESSKMDPETDLCRIGSKIRIRSDYLVYLDLIGSKKFTAHSKPDPWDKKVQKIVRKVQNCQNCGELQILNQKQKK
jgi:hypothetical protein